MNAATTNRRPVKEILDALQAQIAGLKLTDAIDSPALFGRVEFFDEENLVVAFKHLLLTKQRICVIVPLHEQFENAVTAGKLLIKRLLPVALLVSDEVIGDRQAALWGNARTAGAMALAERILPVVTGQLIANPGGVSCSPVDSSVMSIKDDQEGLPNRITIAVELHCRGGTLTAALGPGPTL